LDCRPAQQGKADAPQEKPVQASSAREKQATADGLTLFVDGDYQFSRQGPLTGLAVSEQWGVSLGGRYDITDHWSVGVRGEYFGASDGSEIGTVYNITGTVPYSPVRYLMLSLEPRAEFAQNDLYFGRPYTTDPVTAARVPSLNQNWFFGLWLGATARFGN